MDRPAARVSADRLHDLFNQLVDEMKARGVPLPPAIVGQWGTVGRFIRGAWRAVAAWVCILVLIVNGVVLPIARLFGFDGEPMDWPGLAAFIAGLSALAVMRSRDLNSGVTT